jgi:hypothetical protein
MPLKKITLQEEPNWYFKVIGMLQHNYAFYHKKPNGEVIVYFLHERGSTLNFIPHDVTELNGSVKMNLPNIVDSMEFPDLYSAELALRRNHFYLISEKGKNFDLDSRPTGKVFLDARKYESGIYSKQDKYWIK